MWCPKQGVWYQDRYRTLYVFSRFSGIEIDETRSISIEMGRIKMGTVTQLALRQNLHCTATSPQPRETRIKQMYLHIVWHCLGIRLEDIWKRNVQLFPVGKKLYFLTIEFVSINEILLLSITLSVSPFIEINDFYQHSVTHNNVFTNNLKVVWICTMLREDSTFCSEINQRRHICKKKTYVNRNC